MKKNNSYMDRALRHSDSRYARVLDKLGYGTRHLVSEAKSVKANKDVPPPVKSSPVASEPDLAPEQADELPALRAEYQALIGKRPFPGWDAETLRQKMNEFRAAPGEDSE